MLVKICRISSLWAMNARSALVNACGPRLPPEAHRLDSRIANPRESAVDPTSGTAFRWAHNDRSARRGV